MGSARMGRRLKAVGSACTQNPFPVCAGLRRGHAHFYSHPELKKRYFKKNSLLPWPAPQRPCCTDRGPLRLVGLTRDSGMPRPHSGHPYIPNFLAGYRHWHADLRPDDTPLEAGLAFTCKLKSDIPFLGREAIEAQKEAGIFRRLVCFTIDE